VAEPWDCVVVGGGAAGLSAALVLGRARQRTLLVDAGEPSNRFAHHIGGLLGQDQRPAADFYADGRREVLSYPTTEIRSGSVTGGARTADGFELELADGGRLAARQVILATGSDYVFEPIPGATERWGRSVFHCPFCHGWEVSGRALGVFDPAESGVHRALLLSAWSDDVTLFTNGPAALEPEQLRRLAVAGVAVEERPVAALEGPGDELEQVRFEDGAGRAIGGLLIAVQLRERSDLARRLGAEIEANPLNADAVKVDGAFRTSVPGLSAAGDVQTQMPSVTSAITAGSAAASAVVGALTGAI
jgi:thioredoxin reductase